jgi:hypothetical protein
MKFRYSLSLALTGWYLMSPPLTSDHSIHSEAPISGWQIIDSFDAADACRDALKVLLRESTKWEDWRKDRGTQTVCIATDDPRLKPK